VSPQARPGAALAARPKNGHGASRPSRIRSLNAPDTAGEFNTPWQPLSRQRIEISTLDLMDPRDTEV